MKKYLMTLLFSAVFCLFLGATAFAQQPPSSGGPKAGGYRTLSSDDERAGLAADFALKEKSKEMEVDLSLDSIVKAESQVVAGTNYRVCMEVYAPSKEAETDGVHFVVRAVIYVNLKNEYKLTKWEEIESCE